MPRPVTFNARRTRRAGALERKAKRFEIYEHIGGRFTELLWREAEDEALQAIWEPLPARDARRLREAETSGTSRYGAWHAMTEPEKWDRWLYEWAQTRYVPYVLPSDPNDPGSLFQADFVSYVLTLPQTP
ncbi:MAG: hypothetical protein ABI948_10535 [Thermoleophilia bacterium]